MRASPRERGGLEGVEVVAELQEREAEAAWA